MKASMLRVVLLSFVPAKLRLDHNLCPFRHLLLLSPIYSLANSSSHLRLAHSLSHFQVFPDTPVPNRSSRVALTQYHAGGMFPPYMQVPVAWHVTTAVVATKHCKTKNH